MQSEVKYKGSDGIFLILISQEEIQNEDREISTIQPFMSVLKVIQREKQTNERELNNQVGSLIGITSKIKTYDLCRKRQCSAMRQEGNLFKSLLENRENAQTW